ncbi:MAG TPA: N-acetylmuramoyl-L-alanine amidase [Epsilonproteobacteria bacterium]|nr:N-acetylmuramoyl-L-alanine amidase [Campylobacterota bacterium]HHD78729.1 N-acetylmuramoyl-L-alanine amidase [Campylobacterota bacterium]
MEKNVSVKSFRILCVFFITTVLLFSSVNGLQKAEIRKGELCLKFTHPCDTKKIKQFTLTKPYRRVFDLYNTHLHCSTKNTKDFLRIAQYKPDVVRIVIPFEKPYNCSSYKPLFSTKEYHIPLPKKSSILPAKRYKKPKLHIVTTEKKKHTKAKAPKLTLPTKPHKISLTTSHSHKHELIVIDAGHGGHDTGAIGGGKKEKDLVLSIAKKVAKELKKRGYPVYLTRNSNRFLKLSQRTHIADKKGSIAFISIHANSVPKKYRNKAHGVETFFLQNTRDAKSQRIAARENAAVLKGAGSRLSKQVIIDSVLNGPKIIESNKLAIAVQSRIITNLRKKYRGVKDGGVRHAPFYVLVGASRPSILVEVGYISNPKERARLFTSPYQALIAKGIAEGVSYYLNNRKKEIDL